MVNQTRFDPSKTIINLLYPEHLSLNNDVCIALRVFVKGHGTYWCYLKLVNVTINPKLTIKPNPPIEAVQHCYLEAFAIKSRSGLVPNLEGYWWSIINFNFHPRHSEVPEPVTSPYETLIEILQLGLRKLSKTTLQYPIQHLVITNEVKLYILKTNKTVITTYPVFDVFNKG